MKKFASYLALSSIVLGTACSKSDNQADPGTGGGGTTTPTTVDIRGVISGDKKFSKDTIYRLRGYVYVTNNAKLTIDAGTKIVSNKDSAGVLVIYKGSQILANGTADAPIVFTSNEKTPTPGDLGGVVLVGKATGNGNHKVLEGGVSADYNAFGGTDDADNSGVLKYVRIEYAGKAVNPGDEVNGLSLYAVGSGTTIDYVQVVRGLDDAFEIFGGAVNAKHLIAYNCADDDFDFDDGYHGKIQFAVSVKDPAFTDAKGTTGDISNNFEVDNVNPSNLPFASTPNTFPTLSNFTAVGPNNATGTSSDYGYGMRWRRGAKFILANSIVIGGQKAGLDLDDDSTVSYYKQGISKFYNSFLHAYGKPFQVDKQVLNPVTLDSAGLASLTTGANLSVYYSNYAEIKLTDPFANAAPKLQPASGSPALTKAAKFDAGLLSDAHFEKVTYIGAFDGTNDWTAKWAVWGR
ncbi:hypothetical protein SAMN05421788_101695 [Filimonas lacunae]|uniref:Cell shape-determining protein MreB n=1 Tax=Filimonas lacunae TaxID=477680 RepID=A0A173MNL4_9BACT|nr:hypothetical protein [Filimonas lacunae]BAV09255.1 hypothetical protein FLA_5303 [Filimonas lacunae]SIS69879.1 hypothetical protein SAMN05421788_101695 [Filimonas lacunae]